MKAPRRGVMIVELLAVIAIGTVVVSSAVVLLGLSIEASRAGRKRLSDLSILSDLSHRFRDEVRSARAIDPGRSSEKALTLIKDEGEVVEVQCEAERVSVARRKEKQILNREIYRLPKWMSASVDLSAEPKSIIALVFVQKAGGNTGGRLKTTRIEATLSAGFRFERSRP